MHLRLDLFELGFEALSQMALRDNDRVFAAQALVLGFRDLHLVSVPAPPIRGMGDPCGRSVSGGKARLERKHPSFNGGRAETAERLAGPGPEAGISFVKRHW
ncbi:hypothetical protein GCM10007148_12040 [Parvularcula lutaonensis]|nr:hypothetical protein GCM10007148_12040 [Parvularcula lutaonensis]